MNLLEALVALVILGLAAVGFLDAFQGASRSTRDAAAWVQAVGWAEASIEQTRLGAGAADPALRDPLPQGFTREIDVQPWPALPRLEQVTVTVRLPGGGTFVLHRIGRSP